MTGDNSRNSYLNSEKWRLFEVWSILLCKSVRPLSNYSYFLFTIIENGEFRGLAQHFLCKAQSSDI